MRTHLKALRQSIALVLTILNTAPVAIAEIIATGGGSYSTVLPSE